MKKHWEIKNHRLLSAIVFINGAIIMSIEIIGAKTIAPFFGTSVYVWTAIIGVILGALALGYWKGGVIADKSASLDGLSKIFVTALLILAFTTLLQNSILEIISELIPSIRLQATLASLLLFAPTAFFLGMVSPYVAKLALSELKQSGEIIGKLYALGTFGSIAGTFITGYYLINYVGIRQLYWLFMLGILALAIACKMGANKKLNNKNVVIGLFLGVIFLSLSSSAKAEHSVIFAKDTAYASYQVIETTYNDKKARLLITDNGGAQSGIYIYEPYTPAFTYIDSLTKVVENQHLKPEKILMIGGGTYTLPTILNHRYPEVKIDIVEIDPELDQIAIDYFNYKPTENIKIIHEDGRTFLNNSDNKYDLIIIDAYTSLRPPFHLMTSEAVKGMKRMLNENGLIASNVIGSIDGERSDFASSVKLTFEQQFKNVSVFFTNKRSSNQAQNLLFLASNNKEVLNSASNNFEGAPLDSSGVLLTDNFAPTERLLGDY